MPQLPPLKRRRVDESPPCSSPDTNQPFLDEVELMPQTLRWNLEQDYERRPRKREKQVQSLRLPIKTAEGFLKHLPESSENAELEQKLVQFAASEEKRKHMSEDFHGVNPASTITSIVSRTQELHDAKEELAKLASILNENPEENIGLLRSLAQIANSESGTIRSLGLVTQMAVYKDLIPAYRIRPVSESEMKEKLSKDVRKLRNFEQAIVSTYHDYVVHLGQIGNNMETDISEADKSVTTVAISCAAGMLGAAPHFNYRSDLIRLLVNRLASMRNDENFGLSYRAIKELFLNDDEGDRSFEAVTLLAKMIKAKNYQVNKQVLDLFLHLRLLTELGQKGSDVRIDKQIVNHASQSGRGNKGRDFRNKPQRKLEKEQKKISEEMKEADALVSHEHRDHMQADTLKAVFGIFLRILKARTKGLIDGVLEGLVKYSHLINQDFFGDILETLKDQITSYETQSIEVDHDQDTSHNVSQAFRSSNDQYIREILLCNLTAFSLLRGQDLGSTVNSLHLDLTFFVSSLYKSLYSIAFSTDVEGTRNESKLSKIVPTKDYNEDLNMGHKVHRTIVLLLRALEAVLLPANSRTASPSRLAAFAKQLFTLTLQMPENSTVALAGLLLQMTKQHRKKISPLWNTEEKKGDGIFNPLRAELEASNPFAATIWEGELLRLHFAPSVRASIRRLEVDIQG